MPTLLIPVILPLASTVITGTCVLLPNVPTFVFTVASVVSNVPVPVPTTSPVRVIVWSPVFSPDILVIPSFASSVCVVSSPVLTPLKLAAVMLPLAATLVGVISPRLRLKTPLSVIAPPVATIPLSPTISTLVTVPALDVYPAGFVEL